MPSRTFRTRIFPGGAISSGGGGGGGGSYLVQQDFTNGSGATPGAPTTGNSWTNDGGTWVFNNTSPALPQGGNNAKGGADTGGGTSSTTYTGLTEAWYYFQFQVSSLTSANSTIFKITDGGSNSCSVRMDSAGTLSFFNSNFDGASCSPATTVSINTNYNIWAHYKAGATNGVLELSISTTSTRPTAGAGWAQTTASTMNATMSTLNIGYGDNTAFYYFDHVLMNNSQIGDNP